MFELAKIASSFSMTVWRVVGPIALARAWVEDQVWLAANLLPYTAGALAEALLAVPFGPHLPWLVAGPKGVARVWGTGRRGGVSGLVGTVVIVLITDRSCATRHSVWPIAPLVSWVVKQLLALPEVADFRFGNTLVALIVLDAIVRVREKAVGLWAGEVDGRGVRLARTAVAVPRTTAHLLGKVAPLMSIVIQVVTLAEHVAGAALVTLPIHAAVIWISIEVWPMSVRADLVVGQRV